MLLFAVGVMLYELHHGRRDLRLYAILALLVGTAAFQSLNKLVRLAPHTGGAHDDFVVFVICPAPVGIIYLATIAPPAASGGCGAGYQRATYPPYLLRMQLRYAVLSALERTTTEAAIAVIVIAALWWAMWRFAERPKAD